MEAKKDAAVKKKLKKKIVGILKLSNKAKGEQKSKKKLAKLIAISQAK